MPRTLERWTRDDRPIGLRRHITGSGDLRVGWPAPGLEVYTLAMGWLTDDAQVGIIESPASPLTWVCSRSSTNASRTAAGSRGPSTRSRISRPARRRDTLPVITQSEFMSIPSAAETTASNGMCSIAHRSG